MKDKRFVSKNPPRRVGNVHQPTFWRGWKSLSKLRRSIQDKDEKIRLRIEKEMIVRLKRGSDLGRFDQFLGRWYSFRLQVLSRSKWINLTQDSTVPLEVYSHALKGNKNIIHISFFVMNPDFDFNLFLRDLPLVTSITPDRSVSIPAVHRDILFIKSTNNDSNTFAKKIKLDLSSTYVFSDVGFYALYSDKLARSARVLISFVAPTSGKSLTLRVKHSDEDVPLEVTLGLTKIKLNPSSKSSLTIDDISLYPIEVSGPSESDRLSFEPGIRNDIYIRFILPYHYFNRDFLHDIELLDEAGLEYIPHSASFSNTV